MCRIYSLKAIRVRHRSTPAIAKTLLRAAKQERSTSHLLTASATRWSLLQEDTEAERKMRRTALTTTGHNYYSICCATTFTSGQLVRDKIKVRVPEYFLTNVVRKGE